MEKKRILYVGQEKDEIPKILREQLGIECDCVGGAYEAIEGIDSNLYSGLFMGSMAIKRGEHSIKYSFPTGLFLSTFENSMEVLKKANEKGLTILVLDNLSKDTIGERIMERLGAKIVSLDDYLSAARELFLKKSA